MNHYVDKLTSYVLAHTRPTQLNSYEKKGDRPWNDPVPRVDEERARQPTLKAIIFDMSAVSHVDVTSVQVFVDVRRQLARHTNPDPVWFYFANIRSPWTRRALASAGFGYSEGNVQPVFSVASASSGPVVNEKRQAQQDEESRLGYVTPDKLQVPSDSPLQQMKTTEDLKVDGKLLPIHSVDRPLFSTDVDESLASVLHNLGVALSQTVSNTPSGSPKLNSSPSSGEDVPEQTPLPPAELGRDDKPPL